MNVRAAIQTIADDRAANCFNAVYAQKTARETLEEEGLGIALAQWAQWNGVKLLRVFHAALEDANFHTEAGQVQDMIARVEADAI